MDMPLYPTGRRVCRKCEVEKPIGSFPLQGQGEYRRKDCKLCWSARQAFRQQTRAERQAAWLARRAEQRIRRLPPEDQDYARRLLATTRARRQVAAAVRSGRLIRPQTCQDCGLAHPRIEAHHHDYTEPLSVIWLCHPCHVSWHRPARKQSV